MFWGTRQNYQNIRKGSTLILSDWVLLKSFLFSFPWKSEDCGVSSLICKWVTAFFPFSILYFGKGSLQWCLRGGLQCKVDYSLQLQEEILVVIFQIKRSSICGFVHGRICIWDDSPAAKCSLVKNLYTLLLKKCREILRKIWTYRTVFFLDCCLAPIFVMSLEDSN